MSSRLLVAMPLAWLLVLGSVHQAHGHEPVAPKIVHEVDGTWPEGIRPSTDVVVPILVTVSEQGGVADATIDVSLGPALDAAALAAVQQWRFEPAIIGGATVRARARVAVRFRAPRADSDAGATPSQAAGAPDTPDAGAPVAVQRADASIALPTGAAAGIAGISDATATTKPATALPAPPPALEVSATARVQRPARSASEVVRERDVLTSAPHRTGSDLLLTVPGLFVTQHSGEGKAHQIFYRGFDADHGQDVEIWVGGAPVNEVSNLHGQGYADLHFVMPEVVRTLRASPGTYDPRQGDFALAGTMRFELGYDQPGITAKAGYGSFDTQRYFLAYRPKDAGEGTFGAAEFYKTSGFGPSRAALRASAIAQGVWQLGSHTTARLLLTGYTSNFDSAGVLRLEDIQSGAVSRFGTYDPNQGGASLRSQLVGEVKRHSASSGFGITPYLVLRTLRLRQNFTGYLLDERGDTSQQLNEALTLGATAYYRMKLHLFSPSDAFEVGVSARHDWTEQSQKRLASADQRVTLDEVNARVRALDVAGYLDIALHPFSRLTLRGGVRLDGLSYFAQDKGGDAQGQARTSQGMHLGKKANLELRLVRGLSVLVSYGEGFRSPQARSLADSESTPFTRARSLEAGLRFDDGELRASIAGFYTWLSDDLVFDPATVRNEKVAGTRRAGATADLTWRPLPWLVGNLNVTYTQAEFRTSGAGHKAGDLVPYAPQLVARADIAATPAFGEWHRRKLSAQLGVGMSALARRPLPYGQFGHDVFLLDAQAGLRWGELGVSLRAFNLLDARWYDGEFSFPSNWDPAREGAALVPMRHVTVGAPRSVLGMLEIYF